ncbi:hypothetical protein GCM10018962_18980 [Dactylosporangium matsuzakiense]|uniref:hypothetical protein n=1 Tax=Dactylosporangium matsuzakiense TaxID=53360 RepID=UPI0031E80E90
MLGPLQSVPVLLVCGDKDCLTPLDHTYEITSVPSRGRARDRPDAGHVVLLEH